MVASLSLPALLVLLELGVKADAPFIFLTLALVGAIMDSPKVQVKRETESMMFFADRGHGQSAETNMELPIGKGRMHACILKVQESADAAVMVHWSSRRVNALLPPAKCSPISQLAQKLPRLKNSELWHFSNKVVGDKLSVYSLNTWCCGSNMCNLYKII